MKNFQHKIIVSLFIALLFLTGCDLQPPVEDDIDLAGRTAGSWKNVNSQLRTNNDIPVRIDNDLLFYDEIKPDGATCSDGQILKKTGADNWDCAADTNTTYTASGTLLDETSEVFSINNGTLTDTKYCIYTTGVGIVCNSDGGAGVSTGDSPTWTGEHTFSATTTMATTTMTALTITGTGTSTVITGNVQIDGNLDVTGDVGGTGMVALITTMIAAALVTFASAVVTLTNKRVTMRVTTEASSATPTINTDNSDIHSITALATAITSMTTNLSGTPTNGQKLIIRILDNATGRAITWGASFEDNGVALPNTTTASKLLSIGFIYDTVSSKWGCVASVSET